MTDAAFFLKSPVPKGLPPNVKGIELDPTEYGFACGGADKLCSTAYSQLWSHLGGPSGQVIPKLKAKYGIDGRVAFVGFSAAHGFLNPLLNHEKPDAVLLLDAVFGGGKDGYVKAAKAAAAGGPLLVSITSDKGTTDALNNGDYAWREFVLKPAGLSLAPRGPVPPMPAPAGGVSGAGNLWYYRYSHAQLPHASLSKVLPDAINAHLVTFWGAKRYENLWWWALGAGLAAAGAWWAWSNRSRLLSNGLEVYLARPGQVPGIGHERGRALTDGVAKFVSPHGSYRYVFYSDGVALGALQVVSDGRVARVANVFVRPEVRRRGVATALFRRARRDFPRLTHASESSRSDEAKAWIAGMSKKSGRIAA